MGLDLAWGTRAPTGVAAVGAAGNLLESASLRTDEQIASWVHRPGWAPVVIAIDAPLVVTNDEGARDCEVAISRAYGRFGASCHPANRTRTWFNPPRGQALAREHGWNLDPSHIGTPTNPAAIEVYPHPAMVELFGLDRVIPYKAKAGRSVDYRRAQFALLVDHMARLGPLELSSSPRWAALARESQAAQRQVDLDRIEDEIDAILCAHLAWLWHADRPGMRQFGTGHAVIVVPRSPDALAGPGHVTGSGRTGDDTGAC